MSVGGRWTRARVGVVRLVVCAVAMVLCAVVSAIGALPVSSQQAAADDNGVSAGQQVIQKAASAYLPQSSGNQFEAMLSKYNQTGDQSDTSFSHVIARLFTPTYLNKTPMGVAASGQSSRTYNCDANAAGAGTAVYHNCDVPTVATELIQDVAATMLPEGPQNAEVSSAVLDNAWFGLPTDIPLGGAPANDTSRSVKYTALELFGYNEKFTTYAGEWDHIEVMTSARALSNFGALDFVHLSVSSVANGVLSGLSVGASGALSQLSNGNVLGAIGGFANGFFSGGAAGSINTILDTSDLNVFNNTGWYRVGYGDTLYGARELSEEEVAANAKQQMLNMISQSEPDAAKIPAALADVKTLPADPPQAISSCTIRTGASGATSVWGDVSTSPGPTSAQCQQAAQSAYDSRVAAHGGTPEAGDKADFTWTVDGTQKLQTLAQWKAAHQNYFDAASTYGVACTLGTDEASRADELATFRQCWPNAYASAVRSTLQSVQESNNAQWITSNILDSAALQKWVSQDPSRNFNAPWNRYVCTDEAGNDLTDSTGQQVMEFTSSGAKNSACALLRAPVQNGLFGSGYVSSEGNNPPSADTRNTAFRNQNPLVPVDEIASFVGNLGLGVSQFFTKVSITVVNMSFSPLLGTLGVSSMVVSMVNSFRDSLFFPLLPLAAAVAAISVVFAAVRAKGEGISRQLVSMVLVIVTIFGGIVILFHPEDAIAAVDTVPSQVEQGIVAAVVGTGSGGDELCTASGTVASDAVDTYGTGGSAGTRSMLCDVWRAFVFDPWLYGQWGASYGQLSAAGTGAAASLTNTNGNLVGQAPVTMGGGVTAHNWALYQLQETTSGTASHSDPTVPTGRVSHEFYRIVDAQFGPDGGAGTDSSYASMWSGQNPGARVVVGMLAGVVAFVGMVVLVSYTVSKIAVTFTCVLMLLALPLAFLIGVFSRKHLKSYVATIVGLIIQRLILVLILAVLLRVLVAFAQASGSYLVCVVALLFICVAFWRLRKPMLAMVFTGVSSVAGHPVGAQFLSTPDALVTMTPVGRAARRVGAYTEGAVSGAAGGFVAGGMSGAVHGVKDGVKHAGGGASTHRLPGAGSWRQGRETALSADPRGVENQRMAAFRRTAAWRDYEQKLDAYNAAPSARMSPSGAPVGPPSSPVEVGAWKRLPEASGADGKPVKVDADGMVIDRPVAPTPPPDFTSAIQRRAAAKAARIQKKSDQARAKSGGAVLTPREVQAAREELNVGSGSPKDDSTVTVLPDYRSRVGEVKDRGGEARTRRTRSVERSLRVVTAEQDAHDRGERKLSELQERVKARVRRLIGHDGGVL